MYVCFFFFLACTKVCLWFWFIKRFSFSPWKRSALCRQCRRKFDSVSEDYDESASGSWLLLHAQLALWCVVSGRQDQTCALVRWSTSHMKNVDGEGLFQCSADTERCVRSCHRQSSRLPQFVTAPVSLSTLDSVRGCNEIYLFFSVSLSKLDSVRGCNEFYLFFSAA